MNLFSKEQLNFFKFSTLVLDEFSKVLRQVFITMWDNKVAIRPGFIVWDDSTTVRNMLLRSEGGITEIPTTKSIEEWDCTALFKATIYAKTFGIPSGKGVSTLNDLYLKKYKPVPGSFHPSVQSSTGNQDETYALAIDQLRLFRNKLCHSPKPEITKTDFDDYIQLVKSALSVVNVDTSFVDDIGKMNEDDFPTEKVQQLRECRLKELQAISMLHENMKQKLSSIDERTEKMEKMMGNISLGDRETVPETPNNTENGISLAIAVMKNLFLVPVRLSKASSRTLFWWLILASFLISYVGDNSVFVSDNGCSRPVVISPVNSFGFNEFDFTTQLSYKRENFSGRRWFFSELGDIFESVHAPVGVLITGDPGSGKSALMSQLICSPFSSLAIYDNIIGYHVCDYSEKGTRDGSSFVRNLVHQIASNIPEYADYIADKQHIRTHLDKRCERDPPACFLTAVAGPLRQLESKPSRFKFVVVDAIDECVEKDGETSAILDILRFKILYFPPWLKIIMSSRNGTTVISKVPRTVRRISLNPRDERNIEDIRAYISRYLRKKSSFMSKLLKAISPMEDFSNEIVNELTKRAEGNFLFVKTVLQNNLETDDSIDLDLLPNSLDDTYYQIFQRYFIKEEFDCYEILFEILLASGSLHETEVFEILRNHNQGKRMHDLVEHVSSLLHFGQNGSVSIYHQKFAEWLMNNNNRVKGFSIQKRRGHEYIANFLVSRIKRNRSITYSELSRLCIHLLYSGGPSDSHKAHLKLINVTDIRNHQNGRYILHELARRKNGSRLLEIFVPSFPLVDIHDFEGKTPAYYAASEGSVESLKLFVDKGTCANCILNNLSSLDEIKTIVQMKGYEEFSTMHVATYNGHTKVIDLLLKHNSSFIIFDENVPTLLHIAAERGHLDIVKLLYNNSAEADIISLHHAAARDNFQVVKYLLETAHVKDKCLQCKPMEAFQFSRSRYFYDIHDMFCETALHAAVSKRNINITKLLLQFGNSTIECKHHSGKTPLMDAVERNDTEMVELLLESGANVEEKCGAETLLKFGGPQTSGVRSFHGKRFLYTFYREKTSCACGNKVLHLSAKYGLWHMAKYLINNWNASVTDKNCKGETVWKIANASHNEDFIYHVNRMLLNLDKTSSKQLGIANYRRRTFEKLLRKFFMRTKPFKLSFQCDSTFEGMSPLHIAAIMGVDMLKRVYKKVHEIAPSLPLNCTNKHWIVPKYLAYFYESIHALEAKSLRRLKQTSHNSNVNRNILLQYPDREAEFHLIYNYFYHSPTEETNVLTFQSLTKLENYDVTDCPGFYDLLPRSEDLSLKPYCYRAPPSTKNDVDDEHRDPAASALEKVQYCKGRHYFFCFCVYEIEQRMWFEQYAKDCFCPVVMSELQRWFTSFPKQNHRINKFIAERMGWKDFPHGDYEKRWPVYFLYKKLKNEYQSYKYLEIFNEGFKIDEETDYEYDEH